MPTIDVDCSNLYGKRTGVGRYVSNLLEQWRRKGISAVNLYYKDELSADSFNSYEGFTKKVVHNPLLKKTQIWTNLFLYPELTRSGAEIYFTPNYTLPFLNLRQKKVVTIFDISFISNPEWYPWDQRLALSYGTANTVRKADLIITGSQATKNQILKHYEIDDRKIRVIGLAVDSKLAGTAPPERAEAKKRLRCRYPLKDKVVLFVGLLMNRRNIDVTIKAIGELNRRYANEISFLLVGKDHLYPKVDLRRLAAEQGIQDNFVWLDYVTDEELRDMYAVADCFICASTCEGFNITPLEALQLGAPVVTSRLSSLPEVVGDAAEFMDDPRSVEQQAHGIEKVLFETAYAAKLREKGFARSRQFSWERCAEETYDAIVRSY